MAVHRCCGSVKIGSIRIMTHSKVRERIEWCATHPVWALRLTGDLMLEHAVFPDSTVVAGKTKAPTEPRPKGRLL